MTEELTRKPSEGRCPGSFDEDLISGYLDRSLTQREEQKVRLHLEGCESCKKLYSGLADMRTASLSTRFMVPDDQQWDEAPKGAASLLVRRLGWLLVLTWALSIAAFSVWELIRSPQDFATKLLIFAGFSGFSLLLISVLIDRLKSLPGDRYRRVQK